MSNDNKVLARVPGNLADIGAIVKFTPDGTIQAVRATVTLERERKHFYEVPGGSRDNKTISLTSDGLVWVNRVAGVQLITPPTLWIDGCEQRNPVIQRDDAGNILAVVVRKIAFGRNMLGTYCASEATLVFSPRAYFVRDIIKACGGVWKDGRKVPNPGLGIIKPTAQITDEDRKTKWILDQGLGLALIVNTANDEFLRIFGNYQELCLFAERRAQTICERMALSKHPAIATKVVVPDREGRVKVDVVAWQETDLSREEIRRRAMDLARGEMPSDTERLEQTSTVEDEEVIELPTAPAVEVQPEPAAPAEKPPTPPASKPPEEKAPAKASEPTVEPPVVVKIGKKATKPAATEASGPAMTDLERATLIDELDSLSMSMDEADWIALCKRHNLPSGNLTDAEDAQLRALVAATRAANQ